LILKVLYFIELSILTIDIQNNMKKFVFLTTSFIFMFVNSFCVFSAGIDTLKLYISVKGSDKIAGTKAAPFQSLEKARDQIRILNRTSKDKPKVIYISGGNYFPENPVIFTSEDSGSEKAPVIFKANGNEKPVFTGGKRLKKWKILSEEKKLNLLDKSLTGKIYVTDLKIAGIADFGDPTKAGKRPELYCNQQLQTLARWPNSGFIKAGNAVGKTELPSDYQKVHGSKEGFFEYINSKQDRWANESDVRLGGYWYWDWSEEYQKVAKIDTVSKTIEIAEPFHNYGYKDSLRYFGLNLFCEIDQPGEWYLDRTTGFLYWFPPEGVVPDDADVCLTNFSNPFMIEMKECSNLTLQGLSFCESRGSAILISGGKNCLVSDCRLERFGLDGIHIENGTQHGISGCLLQNLGHGGIKIKGGDRKTLTPSGHFVKNTVVENFSLFKRTYEPAIHADGCGMNISNNRFRCSSSSAMRLEGNDFVIEYNEIANVVNESDDQGGVDIFYNPSYRGIVIRYNHWMDITGGTRHGAAGVRLDDMISGVEIFGNIFENCGALDFGGVQIHGGKDNLVDNNLFFNSYAAVSFSPWSEDRWLSALQRPEIKKKLYEDVDINSSLYQSKYPGLKDLQSDPNKNTVINNLIVNCKHEYLRKPKAAIIRNNDSIQTNDKSLEILCDSAFLKQYGMKPIPLKEIGPKKNRWIN
jgi:hypothetical protein